MRFGQRIYEDLVAYLKDLFKLQDCLGVGCMMKFGFSYRMFDPKTLQQAYALPKNITTNLQESYLTPGPTKVITINLLLLQQPPWPGLILMLQQFTL